MNIHSKGYKLSKLIDGKVVVFYNRPNSARRRRLKAQGWKVEAVRSLLKAANPS